MAIRSSSRRKAHALRAFARAGDRPLRGSARPFLVTGHHDFDQGVHLPGVEGDKTLGRGCRASNLHALHLGACPVATGYRFRTRAMRPCTLAASCRTSNVMGQSSPSRAMTEANRMSSSSSSHSLIAVFRSTLSGNCCGQSSGPGSSHSLSSLARSTASVRAAVAIERRGIGARWARPGRPAQLARRLSS